MRKKLKLSVPIHPLLFAIYPILFLYEKNIALFPLNVIILPIILAVFVAIFLLMELAFVSKKRRKNSLIVSFFLFSFFSFGHYLNVERWLETRLLGISLVNLKKEFILFLLWFVVVCIGVLFIVAKIKKVKKLTQILNVVAVVLVAASLISISLYYVENRMFADQRDNSANTSREVTLFDGVEDKPDIYYIILDGYGSSRILSDMYGFDNSEFLDSLRDKGFYIASDSKSNYIQTSLSLASSLNIEYIDTLINDIDQNSDDRLELYKLIGNSKIAALLSQYGYQFVTISSGYFGTDIKNADVYVSTEYDFGEFENAVVSSTPISLFVKLLPIVQKVDALSLFRSRILNTFEKLSEMPKTQQSPKFVFVHIMSPHPPFVFNQKGEEIDHIESAGGFDGSHLISEEGITKEEYVKLYGDQARFISDKTILMVEAILAKSDKEPMIVVQADHGPGSELDWESYENSNLEERTSILNAYYLPGDGEQYLYDSITPVNSFRIIFNHYFGTNYELLGDESFFSTWSQPYKLIKITDRENEERVEDNTN